MMDNIRNVDGKPALDYTGSNLDEINKDKEVKAMATKYKNRSGPRLNAKKRAIFLRLVEDDASMSEYYKLGFKNKKQVEVKTKDMQKSGRLALKAGKRISTATHVTRSQTMIDTLITQRAIEIIEAMLVELKSTLQTK